MNTLTPDEELMDARLLEIESSFEWLRCVTPINFEPAWKEFSRSRYRTTPRFKYRPLSCDPAALQAELRELELEPSTDRPLSILLYAKQTELSKKIEMLALRETPGFLARSIDLHGCPSEELVIVARRFLAAPKQYDGETRIGPQEIAAAAEEELRYYRNRCADFPSEINISAEMAAGLMVSQGTLWISTHARVQPSRLVALLQHEIGTHLLTYYNGAQQPLRQLRYGLAHYDGLQEGLGLLAEYLSGALPPQRLRIVAARVIAVRRLAEGAGFVELFAELREQYKLHARAAYGVAVRVFRSGGLTKDYLYLKGLQELIQYLGHGGSLDVLLLGKFSMADQPAISELQANRVLLPPRLSPRYMQFDDASERLEHCRNSTLTELIMEAES